MSSAPVLAAVAVWTFGIGVVVALLLALDLFDSLRGFRFVTEAPCCPLRLSFALIAQLLDDVVVLEDSFVAVDVVFDDVLPDLFVAQHEDAAVQHESVDGVWLVFVVQQVELVFESVDAIRSPSPKLKVESGENMRNVFSNMLIFCLLSSSSVEPKGNIEPKVFLKPSRIWS